MSLRTLLDGDAEAQAEHDALVVAAKKAGQDDERTRVTAHLANIEHSKDVVIKAVTEGTPYDSAAGSIYMNAGLKAVQGDARVLDNAGNVVTDDGPDALAAAEKAKVAAVAAAVDKSLEVPADAGAGIFV